MSETNFTETVQNLADKTLAQLSDLFRQLMESEERMNLSKEAESIKSAFYKLLNNLKEEAESKAEDAGDAFLAVEENFKSIYADYKRERAEFNRRQEEERAANLEKKQAVIEELKALLENAETVNFPAFREIQDKWRSIGQVPVANYRDINDTYQFYVEKFYDMVQINRDLRDLDFKKNLEAKEAFCEAAEKLSENENIVNAFAELQKLHEQWKEFGPVAKEYRDDIWNRFKAATAVINKRYQAHFEEVKAKMEENLAAKTELCGKVEEIASREVTSPSDWNAFAKEIEAVQAEWRKIGFATKKENQKIYDRFRAACDAFYAKKREYYNSVKESVNENVGRKMAIIEKAEALKSSTEWKKTTEEFVELQKEWKEIGGIPHKKAEQLWKRFRAACDEFFAERDRNAGPEKDFYGNLKLKKQLVEDIRAYEPTDSETANAEQMRAFSERWNSIGHVPFKDKESVNAAYREAMKEKFPLFASAGAPRRREERQHSPKDELMRRYTALQQEIVTYENNICFFSSSKNASPLIAQIREKIDSAKKELAELETKIRMSAEEAE